MEEESCRLIFIPELVDRGCEYRDGSLEARFLRSYIRCVCNQRQCLLSLASFADDVERALQQEFENRQKDQVRQLQALGADASLVRSKEPVYVGSPIPIVPQHSFHDLRKCNLQPEAELPCGTSFHEWVAKIRVAEWMMVDKVSPDIKAAAASPTLIPRPSSHFAGCDDVNGTLKKRKRFVQSEDDVTPEEASLFVNVYAANTILDQRISSSGKEQNPVDEDGSSSVTVESSPCLDTNKPNVRVEDDEDDLITKLVPLIKRQIEGALNSTLLPLVSVLRSREEDEQRHREQMLALEEQKLALKREKLLFKRRRATQASVVQCEPHSAKLGLKKRSAVRVKIPVL